MRVAVLSAVLLLGSTAAALAQVTGAGGPGNAAGTGNAAAAATNARAAAGETRIATAPLGAAQVQFLGGTQADNCPLPGQAALGTLTLALTAIWNHTDSSCQHIRQSLRAQQLGYKFAAVQIMCDLKPYRKAMARAHTPCEAQHEQ